LVCTDSYGLDDEIDTLEGRKSKESTLWCIRNIFSFKQKWVNFLFWVFFIAFLARVVKHEVSQWLFSIFSFKVPSLLLKQKVNEVNKGATM